MNRREELRDTIERSLPRGRASAASELDAGVDALLHLAGIDDGALAAAERRLAKELKRVRRVGITTDDLGVVGQAYTRAVGRIADAEAEIILAILRETPEDERLGRLQAPIRDTQPARRRTFALLHGDLLRRRPVCRAWPARGRDQVRRRRRLPRRPGSRRRSRTPR